LEQPFVLRERRAAKRLDVSVEFLQKLRVRGGGPPFIRLGTRAVGYRVDDLDAWLASRRRTSTAD
jgi:predicted DNA-binding transcriptional regulator AlpA